MIEAATQLLDQGGPAAVTLRAVGAAAGVSHNAPYRHFADKHALLAAIAARELRRQSADMSPNEGFTPDIQELLRGYVRWALHHPERFRLTFGRWQRDDVGLGKAASAARKTLIDAVAAAQSRHELPDGDPERLAALVLALAHGAADQALAGHLAVDGKGRADAEDLVVDLLRHLRAAAR